MYTNLIRDLVSCTFIYGLLFLFAAVFIDDVIPQYAAVCGWLFTVISIIHEKLNESGFYGK